MHRCEAEALIEAVKVKGIRISCAESCTGGMIGCILTSVPGASEVFMGSAVTYSNQSKQDILNVKEETLLAHGAVSEDTAREMAMGSVKVYRSDVAVAVTGIAGPGGAVPGKPVGTVFIAVSDGSRSVVSEFHFTGDRDSVRSQTASEAIGLLKDFIGGIL